MEFSRRNLAAIMTRLSDQQDYPIRLGALRRSEYVIGITFRST